MLEIPLLSDKSLLSNHHLVLAYIDPGSGSILLQYLIAALVGVAIYFRKFFANFLHTIKAKFNRKPK